MQGEMEGPKDGDSGRGLGASELDRGRSGPMLADVGCRRRGNRESHVGGLGLSYRSADVIPAVSLMGWSCSFR